jgi:hypothetical protein
MQLLLWAACCRCHDLHFCQMLLLLALLVLLLLAGQQLAARQGTWGC